jgi:hypothetical protein
MLPVALVGAGVALAFLGTRGPRNLVSVKSNVDGKEYKVQNLPDKQDGADMMANICSKVERLIENYKNDPSAMGDPRVKVMVERFKPENFSENDLDASSTSYSENKGDKIVVCMRDKTPPYKLVDENTVTYVILHEMAHLMTTTIGHTPEFWANFRRILLDASGLGIYTPVNYARAPVAYCGMEITDSPI